MSAFSSSGCQGCDRGQPTLTRQPIEGPAHLMVVLVAALRTLTNRKGGASCSDGAPAAADPALVPNASHLRSARGMVGTGATKLWRDAWSRARDCWTARSR